MSGDVLAAGTPTEVKTLQVNGVRIACTEVGTGEPLVLVHGSWSSRRSWDLVVPGLAAQHRVVTYDRRGHGQSERPAGQGTFAEDVGDLAALLEALEVAPAWVVGNSVGAIIVLQLAATRPELLRGIVVHEPPLRPQLSAGGADEPLRAVLALIRAGDHAAAAELFVEGVALGSGAWSALSDQMRASMSDHAPTFLDEELAPDSRTVDEAALARYSEPVLITSGGQSPAAFTSVSTHLATLLPHAHRLGLPTAGHVPQLTHPTAFVEQVTSFCRTNGVPHLLKDRP